MPKTPPTSKPRNSCATCTTPWRQAATPGHELKRFLVRILFCLFAEDNGIFPPKAFELFLRDRTAEDGSDLGVRLEQLFRILNTDTPQRQHNLDEELKEFPYVNGDLFAEHLEFAEFNTDMRNRLLACCGFRWETISPAVFGSLFQAVMDSRERRQIGAHYTAEKNILKLIRSLFLDELRAEFETIKATAPPGAPRECKSFTTSWQGSVSSIPPAAAATSSSSPTANSASWNSKSW